MKKEKMIQEMVNGLEHCDVDNDCDSCVKKNYPCYIYDWCKTLVEKGYRKVSEGAVVLTKEEYERLKSDRKIKVVQHLDDEFTIEIPQCEYDEMLEQVRKKTAKEILQKMKEKCKELEDKFSHICKSKKECLMETCRYEGVLAVKKELYELSKEYSIESVEVE